MMVMHVCKLRSIYRKKEDEWRLRIANSRGVLARLDLGQFSVSCYLNIPQVYKNFWTQFKTSTITTPLNLSNQEKEEIFT